MQAMLTRHGDRCKTRRNAVANQEIAVAQLIKGRGGMSNFVGAPWRHDGLESKTAVKAGPVHVGLAQALTNMTGGPHFDEPKTQTTQSVSA